MWHNVTIYLRIDKKIKRYYDGVVKSCTFGGVGWCGSGWDEMRWCGSGWDEVGWDQTRGGFGIIQGVGWDQTDTNFYNPREIFVYLYLKKTTHYFFNKNNYKLAVLNGL